MERHGPLASPKPRKRGRNGSLFFIMRERKKERKAEQFSFERLGEETPAGPLRERALHKDNNNTYVIKRERWTAPLQQTRGKERG